MRLILLLIGILLYSSSCIRDILADDKLTLKKEPYIGNQLRIDGYYYVMDLNNSVISTLFFYRNGLLLYGGGGRPGSVGFDELEADLFTSETFLNTIKNHKSCWGIFQIIDNEIRYEKWYPSSGGGMPAYLSIGEIQNDTTFVITKAIRPKTDETLVLNEVFHFRAFAPKPDSTNNVIP
ncbi:MAG: hypothetical protein ACOX0M_06150 [Salinivirgaceae bacterium]|jgi:hypothetical protein|nr:hypothetical protein [Bacteroidales bacterium]